MNIKIIEYASKIIDICSKTSWSTIIKFFFIASVFLLYDHYSNLPQRIIDRQKIEHNESLNKRREIDSKIQLVMSKLLYNTMADRVLISEMHNGESNLNGLPFLKFTARYEDKRRELTPIARDYERVNTSNYRFVNRIYTDGFLYCSIKELEPIDSRLYYELKEVGVKYVFMQLLSDVGFVFIMYNTEPDNKEKIKTELTKSSYDLLLLLK